MKKADKILQFLKFSSKLKSQKRTIKLSGERQESVADHSWQVCLLVLLVQPYLKNEVEIFKALKMALIHDLAEAEIGDIPHGVTATNRKIKLQKRKDEEREMKKIKKMIGGKLGAEFYDLWSEFETGQTREAKLVRALDSLEANQQSIRFDVDYWDDYFYSIALTKAEKHCRHEDILCKLNSLITTGMETEFRKIGLDVEKIKGEGIISTRL
ncbi:MAG: HD domain-containing protein [bacterium]|nr:HD domain-containing protein [bacterium]